MTLPLLLGRYMTKIYTYMYIYKLNKRYMYKLKYVSLRILMMLPQLVWLKKKYLVKLG